jgi:cytochrome bd-type quinol oxidase subunit 2
MNAPIAWIIVGGLCLANVVVSLLVKRSRYYSAWQKLAQYTIIWLLPLIGAVAIWAFLRAQEDAEVFDTRAYPERSKKAVAVEIEHAIHDSAGGGSHGGGGSD